MKTINLTILLLLSILTHANSSGHPSLFLTPNGVQEIKASLGKYPAFDKSYQELKAIADEAINSNISVPIPKDNGGGFTHEKHKNNYYQMNAAGTLYQLTGNKKYAQFVHDMLINYAQIYPTLELHPAAKSESAGKLFWQTLNDAVWLVHTANAYDCIYDFLNEKDRSIIEKGLFYPMAEFISNGNPNNYATFNRMHNHGTWAMAAVGMIGYVMKDKNLVDKALYGSAKDGKTGFIKQLDALFSPDGYFTEGPYYQRYSIWPFITFAQVIENNQPELKIFYYRDGILFKAVNTLLQCAYNDEIFYLNDALTKTFNTQEIVYAVDIAYQNNPANKQLLDIAMRQGAFVVSNAGLKTAKDLSRKLEIPFKSKSILLRDGEKGDEGGIAIFRTGEAPAQTCLTFKATSHGLSHGHYDKLSIGLYDNGNNILPDYGAVRFLNIEQKNGGGYTKENYTWGAQTIAHNTVTVDEKSNFNAKIKVSSLYHSDIIFCDYTNPTIQVVSGTEHNAYEGVNMQRTTALVAQKDFEFPIVIDLFRVNSDTTHTLDFPFYYKGQLVSTSFEYQKNTTQMSALGTKNGYQHLWVEATAKSNNPNACFTWVNGTRFYSITTLTNANTQLLMTRIGAGDPDFNLRNDPCFMIREPNKTNHTFVSIIEPHGLYDLNREVTSNFESIVANVELIKDDATNSAVKISTKSGKAFIYIVVNKDFDQTKERTVMLKEKMITFKGNYYFSEFKN